MDIFGAWNAGWRQPSFLGHHDLAALAAIGLALAAAAIAARRREIPAPRLFAAALVAGVLGLILAGSVAAAGGLALGVIALWAASRRRFAPGGRQALALIAIVAVVAGGVTAVRGDALEDFLRFLGVRGDEPPIGVESYSQRTVLAYIGLRIAQDDPILGVGWQRSSRPEVFEPYLADARERFPDVDDLAFPAEGREWGVQNLYIQMLADAGVIGLALLLLVGAAGLVLAWRAGTRAPTPWAAGAGLRRPLRAPHDRRGVGVARHRRRDSTAGCDVPPARTRGRRCRGGSGRRCLIRDVDSSDRRCRPTRPRAARPLAAEQADDAHGAIGRYRVLDVGCGAKPYEPLLRTRTPRRTSASTPSTTRGRAQRAGRGPPCRGLELRRRPLQPGARALRQPVKAVSELRASPRRAARARHHARRHALPPLPDRLLALDARRASRSSSPTTATWASVRVTPRTGTTACVGMLLAMYLDLGLRRVGLGAVARPLIAAINTVASGIDARSTRMREPAPGELYRELPRHGRDASMKTLVTGGGGFIGSNVVRALLERGDDVRVLDNFSTGSRRNLAGLDVEVVEGELRSYERVHNAVRGTEVVFHLGALGSVPRSVQDPLTSSAVNVEGTLNVQLAARDEGVRRVIFASSSSIYGNQSELPLRESMAPDPISPYGVAKLAAERYCVSFSRVYHSFETVVLRYFNVFGPRQDPTSQYAAVVPLFITAIAAGEPVTIFDDGEQSRDFTYVDNVVAANLLAADADGANGRIFNISGELRRASTSSPRRSAACSESRSSAAICRLDPATCGTRGRT